MTLPRFKPGVSQIQVERIPVTPVLAVRVLKQWTGPQLIKNVPVFYGTWICHYITRACHCILLSICTGCIIVSSSHSVAHWFPLHACLWTYIEGWVSFCIFGSICGGKYGRFWDIFRVCWLCTLSNICCSHTVLVLVCVCVNQNVYVHKVLFLDNVYFNTEV